MWVGADIEEGNSYRQGRKTDMLVVATGGQCSTTRPTRDLHSQSIDVARKGRVEVEGINGLNTLARYFHGHTSPENNALMASEENRFDNLRACSLINLNVVSCERAFYTRKGADLFRLRRGPSVAAFHGIESAERRRVLPWTIRRHAQERAS